MYQPDDNNNNNYQTIKSSQLQKSILKSLFSESAGIGPEQKEKKRHRKENQI